jgi:hypothetical protein
MIDEAVEHGDLVREGDRLWHPEHVQCHAVMAAIIAELGVCHVRQGG